MDTAALHFCMGKRIHGPRQQSTLVAPRAGLAGRGIRLCSSLAARFGV